MKEYDVVCAERDRALALLDKLESLLSRSGFMFPQDQITLHEARALLISSGTRKSDAPPVWVDRDHPPRRQLDPKKIEDAFREYHGPSTCTDTGHPCSCTIIGESCKRHSR